MSHESPQPRQAAAGTFLVKYWPLIAAIAGIIVMWTTTNNTVASDTDRITTVEAKQQAYDSAQTQVLVQLSQIQSDLTWIKQKFK